MPPPNSTQGNERPPHHVFGDRQRGRYICTWLRRRSFGRFGPFRRLATWPLHSHVAAAGDRRTPGSRPAPDIPRGIRPLGRRSGEARCQTLSNQINSFFSKGGFHGIGPDRRPALRSNNAPPLASPFCAPETVSHRNSVRLRISGILPSDNYPCPTLVKPPWQFAILSLHSPRFDVGLNLPERRVCGSFAKG